MPEFVEMTHPEVEGSAKATRQAFDDVWSEKGWTLVERGPEEEVVYAESPVWASGSEPNATPDSTDSEPGDDVVTEPGDGDSPAS